MHFIQKLACVATSAMLVGQVAAVDSLNKARDNGVLLKRQAAANSSSVAVETPTPVPSGSGVVVPVTTVTTPASSGLSVSVVSTGQPIGSIPVVSSVATVPAGSSVIPTVAPGSTTATTPATSSPAAASPGLQITAGLNTWELLGCFASTDGFAGFDLAISNTAANFTVEICLNACGLEIDIFAGVGPQGCYCSRGISAGTARIASESCTLPSLTRKRSIDRRQVVGTLSIFQVVAGPLVGVVPGVITPIPAPGTIVNVINTFVFVDITININVNGASIPGLATFTYTSDITYTHCGCTTSPAPTIPVTTVTTSASGLGTQTLTLPLTTVTNADGSVSTAVVTPGSSSVSTGSDQSPATGGDASAAGSAPAAEFTGAASTVRDMGAACALAVVVAAVMVL